MSDVSKETSAKRQSPRLWLYDVLEGGHSGNRISLCVDGFLFALIIVNVVAFAFGTVDRFYARYGSLLEILNIVSVAIFTVEYVARMWVCVEHLPLRHLAPWKARLKFAFRPLMLVDFLAVAPFYLSVLFQIDLRVLRVFRLVRFLKLARYSPALQTLARVVINERHALVGSAIVMCALLMFASTVMYFLERHVQPEDFGSVPAAAWWAVATLTTVGYGDVTPATDMGKLFGGLMMIFGLGMFALPIGIMATGFAQEINRREFVITWSMVAKVPVFERLKASTIATVMGMLKSQSFPAGGFIVRQGDHVDAMYFITAGEVEVQTKQGDRRMLSEGHSFGEAALFGEEYSHVASAAAVTGCDLLMLERHDFERLRSQDPELEAELRKSSPDYLKHMLEDEAEG
jgi:voltage-gated potassium channel